jgi:metal-responsive CopG/Arc/MetJ family transcriptional regulator
MSVRGQRVSVSLPKELHDLAAKVAQREGRTLVEIMRRALTLYAKQNRPTKAPKP